MQEDPGLVFCNGWLLPVDTLGGEPLEPTTCALTAVDLLAARVSSWWFSGRVRGSGARTDPIGSIRPGQAGVCLAASQGVVASGCCCGLGLRQVRPSAQPLRPCVLLRAHMSMARVGSAVKALNEAGLRRCNQAEEAARERWASVLSP